MIGSNEREEYGHVAVSLLGSTLHMKNLFRGIVRLFLPAYCDRRPQGYWVSWLFSVSSDEEGYEVHRTL